MQLFSRANRGMLRRALPVIGVACTGAWLAADCKVGKGFRCFPNMVGGRGVPLFGY